MRVTYTLGQLASFKERLKALEAQVAALEKKKYDDEACGEI